MTIKIYGFPTFNVSKCTLTAEFAGIKYDYVHLDPMAGEHKTPEHHGRHPLGKVPALETEEGESLFESAAICRYLGRVSDRPVYSGDALALGRIDQWIDYFNVHVGRWIASFYFQEVVRKTFNQQPIVESELETAQTWLDQQMPAVDQALANSDYLTGDKLTIADPFGAALIQVHEVTRFDPSPWPNVVRWYERLRSDSAYDRAMAHFPGDQLWH